MVYYSDRRQRRVQVGSLSRLDISKCKRCKVLTNLQKTAAMSATADEGILASPFIILDDDSDVEARDASRHASRVVSRVPNQGEAVPDPPVPGGTYRFRGLALAVIGQLFPNATFWIHRVGFPASLDLQGTGTDLAVAHALIDSEAIFRLTMTRCDTPVEAEGPLVWSMRISIPNGLTADEYCSILKLGKLRLGRIILFTHCTRKNHSWGLIRQVPGRDHILEDSLDIIQVPREHRAEVRRFGAKDWVDGARIPRMYTCKDLSFGAVKCKITNIMRD